MKEGELTSSATAGLGIAGIMLIAYTLLFPDNFYIGLASFTTGILLLGFAAIANSSASIGLKPLTTILWGGARLKKLTRVPLKKIPALTTSGEYLAGQQHRLHRAVFQGSRHLPANAQDRIYAGAWFHEPGRSAGTAIVLRNSGTDEPALVECRTSRCFGDVAYCENAVVGGNQQSGERPYQGQDDRAASGRPR